MSTKTELIRIEGLRKYFPIQAGVLRKVVGHVKAVERVSFSVYQGETLGLVGESGCGKTTTGRLLLRLIEPTEGSVSFEGRDIYTLSREEMRRARRDMQIIFQDPFSSLHPRMRVHELIAEPIRFHGLLTGKQAIHKRVNELLDVVGLPVSYRNRYPHEFSGGQRQRIGIARGLAVSPKFIVCDEPVSALDVSIQAQVLNLLSDLQREFNLTYLFIAHDLSVVRHTSDRIAVMYLGRIVEIVDSDRLFEQPLHPYCEALLSAIPVPDPDAQRTQILLTGDVPSPANPPTGCHFHPRCPYAVDRCRRELPELRRFTATDGSIREAACHRVEELELASPVSTPA